MDGPNSQTFSGPGQTQTGQRSPVQIRTGQEAGAVGMTGAEIEVSPWQMGEELSQKLGSTSKEPSVRNVSETTKEGFSGGKGPSPGKKRLSRWDSLTLQE